MDRLLDQKQLKELVLITAETLGIKYPSIIEKDYYVTQVILALSTVESEYFRLVFCGGTCLAKAHKIVKRMSEDIDFKIQLKNTQKPFSKSWLLKKLKKFRMQIMVSLRIPNVTITDSAVRNKGKYLRVELTYPALFASNAVLRPHLLLEFTFADIHLTTNSLMINMINMINMIIEDVITLEAIFSSLPVDCISLEETAIEKWAALTRGIVAIDRQYHYDDKALVRHIYDLNAVKKVDKINDIFFNLAKAIVNNDANQFKNQHPEYFINSSAEIKESLVLLKNKPIWQERYQEFIETMVYDNADALEYGKALNTLEDISLRAIANLTHC